MGYYSFAIIHSSPWILKVATGVMNKLKINSFEILWVIMLLQLSTPVLGYSRFF
jgi:hypothetical protein